MANDYYSLTTVTRTTAGFAVAPDIAATITPTSESDCHLILINEDASSVVEYSFDGTNVHGTLKPTLPSAGKVFDGRYADRIWFRLSSGTTAAVCVEAWVSA